MKKLAFSLLLLFFKTGSTYADFLPKKAENPLESPFVLPKDTDVVDSCVALIKERPILVLRPSSSLKEDRYFGAVAYKEADFMLGTLCDLMCTKAYMQLNSTTIPGSWSYYAGGRALNRYGDEARPYLTDVYVDPQVVYPHIEDKEKLEARRQVAYDLLLYSYQTKTVGVTDDRFFVRKQAAEYRSYAQRMRALAERVDTAPALPVPTTPEAKASDATLRRACEIMLRLEAAPDTPFKAGEEAALVNELVTLHQPVSASTLLGYLAKSVEGVDTKTIQSAVAPLGDEAIPDTLRFLRTDKRSPEALKAALPVLVALCKTPEAAKARLLQAAQTDEDGAKRFEDHVLVMTQ